MGSTLGKFIEGAAESIPNDLRREGRGNDGEISEKSVNDNEISKKPVIFVSGIPGAGNRTASERISSITGFHTIYPGDLKRNEVNDLSKTNSGKKLYKSKNKVPEKSMVKMIKDEMVKNDEAKGYIIGGFPRNKKSSNAFAKEVKKPEKVIALRVGDEIASLRLENKLIELGKPENEISQAEDIVRSAIPKIKKVHKSFDENTLVTVNSSTNNMNNWYRAIENATKDIIKNGESDNDENASKKSSDDEL